MKERRLFNLGERVSMYLASDGRCACCGAQLEAGWHGDHVVPWSKGGPTALSNGQALCPKCSLRKGNRMEPTVGPQDSVELRFFQRDLIEQVTDRVTRGEKITVADIFPGLGKTLGAQHVATMLMRRGLIDAAAIFVPRRNLCHQFEMSWWNPGANNGAGKGSRAMYGHPRPDEFRWSMNNPPLTPRGVPAYVTTYSSLATAPDLHKKWARDHHGRFLLVCDEAQFLGLDAEDGGTRAAALIKDLIPHSFHTIVMTGTPCRADDRPILGDLLTEWYSDPNAKGYRYLRPDVHGGYKEGVSAEHLRPFESKLCNGPTRWRDVERKVDELSAISELQAHLGAVLDDPRVWQPIANEVVAYLDERRRLDRRYQALIACSNQTHASAVKRYLEQQRPDLRTVLAISDEGEEARRTLASFREDNGDVLITVRMAFIGYDCKPITVVGVLTNYRDDGHLKQLVGRGIRMWDERPVKEQHVLVVGPDDPKMAKFCNDLREESQQGIKERPDDAEPGDPFPKPRAGYLADAEITSTRAMGYEATGDLSAEQLALIEEQRTTIGLVDPATVLMRFLDANGSHPSPPATAPRTTSPSGEPFIDLRKRLGAKVQRRACSLATKRTGLTAGPEFQAEVTAIHNRLNQIQGVKSIDDLHSREALEDRLLLVEKMHQEAAA